MTEAGSRDESDDVCIWVTRVLAMYEDLFRETQRGKLVSGFLWFLLAFVDGLYLWQWVPTADPPSWWWRPAAGYAVVTVVAHRGYVGLPVVRARGPQAVGPVFKEIMTGSPGTEKPNRKDRHYLETLDAVALEVIYRSIARRWYTSLWIPTVLLLAGVAGMVYFTGGAIDSPIAVLPAAMVTAGMLVAAVPHVKPPETYGQALKVAWMAIRHFIWAIGLLVLTYMSLIAAPYWLPSMTVPDATILEKALVVSLTTLFTTVVTFIARAGLPPADEPADLRRVS